MSDRTLSRTALGAASMRVVHQLFDRRPLILEDPISARLLGPEIVGGLHDPAARHRAPDAGALRSHVVLRSRYAEDRLAAAAARGVTQCVLLGAGLDTFALRQPAWAAALAILEVDRPETQASKRAMLARAGLVLPPNAGFAGLDLEREPVRDGLVRHGLSLAEPTFFSWLGVTMYLARDAVDAVLAAVASFPAGSEIVLSFAQPPPPESDPSATLARRVASVGEPFVSYFAPEELAAKLGAAGFTDTGFLSPEEARARYFDPDRGDLPAPRQTKIAWARR